MINEKLGKYIDWREPREPEAGYVSILQISDLHLSRRTDTVDGSKEPSGSAKRNEGLGLFEGELRRACDEHKFDLIAITGDLVEGERRIGDHQETLDEARAYVDKLRVTFGWDERQILVIPGNHDYRWMGLWRLGSRDHPRYFRERFAD